MPLNRTTLIFPSIQMVIMQSSPAPVTKTESGVETKSTSKERCCHLCGALFRSVTRLKRHLQAHEDRLVDQKGLQFSSKEIKYDPDFIKPDVDIKHEESAGKEEKLKKGQVHKCTFCGEFVLPKEFSEHLVRHYSLMFYEDSTASEDHIDFAQVPEDPTGGIVRSSLPEIKYMVCCKCMKRFQNSTLLLRHTADFHQGQGHIVLMLD